MKYLTWSSGMKYTKMLPLYLQKFGMTYTQKLEFIQMKYTGMLFNITLGDGGFKH